MTVWAYIEDDDCDETYVGFTYKIVCRGRVFHTNSRSRFRKHYRAAKKRGLFGRWLVWSYNNDTCFHEYTVWRWR